VDGLDKRCVRAFTPKSRTRSYYIIRSTMSLPYHHTVASPPLSPLVPQRGPHFEQSEKTHYQEKDEQPPRLVASPTDYVADELPRRHTIDSSNQGGHELKIYPLSSIALIAWTVYIVVLFWLCEKAVAVSKTSVHIS
jgi:hypothetical protein